MRIRFALSICLSLAHVLSAQRQPPTQQPGAGPTMAMTKTWLENDTNGLLKGFWSHIDRQNDVREWRTTHLSRLMLADCVLSWTDTTTNYLGTSRGIDTTTIVSRNRVPLRDLDVASIEVKSHPLLVVDPFRVMYMRTRPSVGKSITVWDAKKTRPDSFGSMLMYVATQRDADRVANAVGHAAVPCGAPVSPF